MNRRGFTLLELILSLAITVIIAGTLATTLQIAYRARAAADRAIVAARTTGLLTHILSRDLENALPPNGILASEFLGEVDAIAFYTTASEPDATVPGDIKRVEYELVAATDGTMELVRRVNSNLLESIAEDLPEEVICRDITLMELSYFDGEVWTDTWDSTVTENTLPLAVRALVEMQPRNTRRAVSVDHYIQIRCSSPAADMGDDQ